METKRIQLKDHLAHAWPIVIYFLVSFALIIYMVYKYGKEDLTLFVIMALLIFFIFAIPLTILHLDYYVLNRDDVLHFGPQGLKYSHQGIIHDINWSDINEIETFKSYPLAENRVHWFPWDSYHYSIIKLFNGKIFLITSLLFAEIGSIEELKSKETVFKTFLPLTKEQKERPTSNTGYTI